MHLLATICGSGVIWLGTVLAGVDPQWASLAGGIVAAWVRLEHRITKLETKLKIR